MDHYITIKLQADHADKTRPPEMLQIKTYKLKQMTERDRARLTVKINQAVKDLL